jgi:hypothetical protein
VIGEIFGSQIRRSSRGIGLLFLNLRISNNWTKEGRSNGTLVWSLGKKYVRLPRHMLIVEYRNRAFTR